MKRHICTMLALSALAAPVAQADLVDIIGIMGGIATGGQTVQAVRNGTMVPIRGAQVAAGGVNAYVGNQPYGQAALGAVSAAQAFTGGAGSAVDPTYDAISRLGSIANPNDANLATAALSTAQSVGLYDPRPVNSTALTVPKINHPALAPLYQ